MSTQSDAVAWWRMGRAAKAKGYDIAKWAADIKYVAARKLFLAGANGEPKPAVRVNRLPKHGLPPIAAREPKSDDGLVEQTLALLHRLREVAGKTTPEALYARIPEQLHHNLDLSLNQATEFLFGLNRANYQKKKTAGEPAAQITDQPKEGYAPMAKRK